MTSEQWEALCVRAAAWAHAGPERGWVTEDECAAYRTGPTRHRYIHNELSWLALFARLMAVAFKRQPNHATNITCPVCIRAGGICGDCATEPDMPVNMAAIELVKLGPDKLLSALLRVHDGSDRGELKALLRKAWGPQAMNMSAPDGPVCICGNASRYQSGWCGMCTL